MDLDSRCRVHSIETKHYVHKLIFQQSIMGKHILKQTNFNKASWANIFSNEDLLKTHDRNIVYFLKQNEHNITVVYNNSCDINGGIVMQDALTEYGMEVNTSKSVLLAPAREKRLRLAADLAWGAHDRDHIARVDDSRTALTTREGRVGRTPNTAA
eukprot:5926180-Amphidinium_carterae.3